MVYFAYLAATHDIKTFLASDISPKPLAGQDEEKKYPNLQDKPFGKGVFAHVRRTGNTNPASKDQIEEWAKEPYIAGTQLSYSWAEIEPQEGKYQWDIIEKDMEPWAREGKKSWIEVTTANKRDKTDSGRGTPEWVFQKGIPKVKAENTASYPVFWNPSYIELWGNFIRAFANKFDGDPRIEFVVTGGYSNGHEPNLSAWDNDVLMDQWIEVGFDGFTSSGVYLNKAIKPILKIFPDAFRKTPIAQIIHAKTDFDQALNEFAASMKFILLSNGLSVKHANTQSRQAWRDRREKLGVKVGFAEWGPRGRETDLYQAQLKKQRKQALKKGSEPEKIRKGRDWSTMAKLMDIYRAAVGDDSDPNLRPYSRMSYLPLGRQITEAETRQEWEAALKWAWEHLEE